MQTNTLVPDIEFKPGVKSRPTYAPVSLNTATSHQVFIAQDGTHKAAAMAALQPLQQQAESDGKFTLLTLLVTDKDSAAENDVIRLSQLAEAAAALPVSVSFYLAGSEAFLWDVAKTLQDAGFVAAQIYMLAPVSNERRLFCTHCYSVMEPVMYSPYKCTGCGRNLLVRDHFSKIHRAYVGVQIDAEDPADLPAEVEELS